MRRALAVALAALGGCLFPSVSELGGDGGDDVVVPSEAAPDAPQEAATDAPADAPLDSGFDCAAHTFCDDFTTGESLGAKWSSFSLDGVTLSIDGAASTSPPSSLLAVIPAVDASGPSALLEEDITPSASTPHFAFAWDTRVDGLSSTETDNDIHVFALSADDPDFAYYEIDLSIGSSAWLVGAGGLDADGGIPVGTTSNVPSLANGTWRHVALDVRVGANPSWALAFDGTPVASGQLPPLGNATAYHASFGVIGLYLPDGTVGSSVRFDDFTFDALAQ